METLKNYLLAKGLSQNTAETYVRGTLKFITWLDQQNIEVENVSSRDIMAYLNYLQSLGHANTTRGIQLNIIRLFYDFQIHHQKCSINPSQHIKIRGIKRQTLYPILSKQELENIYQSYFVPENDDPRSNRNWFKYYQLSRQRNKTILGLMIWQGLTTAEINHLTLQNVKLRQGIIEIVGGRKSALRNLELKPQQIMELMEYQLSTRTELLKYAHDPTQTNFYLTAPSSGKVLAKNATNDSLNIWKLLSDEIKTTHPRFINFKQVRASVITQWLGQYNLRQVQYMAGHKYVNTTERYLVNQVDDLKSDIEQFHPIG